MNIYKFKNQIYEVGRGVRLINCTTNRYLVLAFDDLSFAKHYVIEAIKPSNNVAGFTITINNRDFDPLYFTTKR